MCGGDGDVLLQSAEFPEDDSTAVPCGGDDRGSGVFLDSGDDLLGDAMSFEEKMTWSIMLVLLAVAVWFK